MDPLKPPAKSLAAVRRMYAVSRCAELRGAVSGEILRRSIQVGGALRRGRSEQHTQIRAMYGPATLLPLVVSVRDCCRAPLRVLLICFFFQAEDGIRDDLVTGVQTCALPISSRREVESSILRLLANRPPGETPRAFNGASTFSKTVSQGNSAKLWNTMDTFSHGPDRKSVV